MSWGWDDLSDYTEKKKRPRKRKRGRGRASPTGPYPAESSTKSIRDRATPAERERFAKGESRTAKRAQRLAAGDRRAKRAEERAAARDKPSTREREKQVRKTYEDAGEEVPRSVTTLLRAERRLERREDKKLREATRRLRQSLASEALYKARLKTPEGSGGFPDKALEHVSPRAYKKALRAATRAGSSGGLGEPEDLTIAVTSLAPGAGFVGALGKRAAQVGGKKVAKEVAEAAAGKVESTAMRAGRAGSNVRAVGRATRNVGRRARKKPPIKKTRKVRESRYAQVSLPGVKAGKVGGSQAFPVVRGHEQAIIEEPTKTAKTTARAVGGVPKAIAMTAIAPPITAGRAASDALHGAGVPGFKGYTGKEILAPVKGVVKEQVDFGRQVAKIITASDTEEVKRAVEEDLGLMLPIMLGISGVGLGKKVSKGRVREAVRKIVERQREKRGKGHGYEDGKAPRVLERTGQRKASAKTVATSRTRIKLELQERQRGIVEAAREAGDSEVVRKGAGRNKKGKPVDVVIRDADVASFLQRHPMKLDDPVAMFAEVKRIKARLKDPPEGMAPDPSKLSTRDVIAHIEKRPDVLANPAVIDVVRQYRNQGAYARERKETLSPEHSERARFLPAATTRDIAFPEERFPGEIRSLTRATARRGKNAKDVLRKEARRDRSRSRANRKKAATLEKKAAIMRRELATREKLNKDKLELGPTKAQLRELKAIKAMERRGVIPRDRMPVGGHLQLVTPRKGKAPSSAKAAPALHDRIRDRIDKIDAQVVALKEKSILDEKMAIAKVKASRGDLRPELIDEFAADVVATLQREGITELPEYQYAGPGRTHSAPVYGSSGSKLTQMPGKSKRRKGTAEEFGLVEEGVRPMVRESIARPLSRRESYKASREVMEGNRFEPGGKKEWNAREADELFSGPDPVLSADQWMKVPRQFYKRIYDVLEGKGKGKGISERDMEFVAGLDAARKGEAKGSHYMIVRKAAMDELVSQLSNELISPTLSKVNRATSFLILGTSPAWAAMQIVAEYGQASIAQPRLLNPAFVKKAVAAYKAMDPEKRQAFDSWVGVTAFKIEKADDLKLDLKAGDLDAAAKAYGALNESPYGRVLKGIPTSIQRVDQWKGGRIRALATLAKIDKDLNGAANHFVRGVGGLHREMGAAMKEMQGKSLKQQAEWVAQHPKWAKRYQSYLDDVLGNWAALTKNERVASQAMIFYPFMRMSLRWTFYSFPKRHPVKASMIYYLGQQNANELKKLLGGNPSYFTQWSMVPLDLGGKEKKLVDLSRIAPGSNVLIEALGGSAEGPKGIAAAKASQPALAALGTAVYGVTPLSGQQEENSGLNAMAQLLPTTLSAPGRAITEALVPGGRKRAEGLPAIPGMPTERQEALDKLSAKLRQYDTAVRYARTLIAPPLPKDLGKEADSAMLGRVLKAFEKNSSSARDELSAVYAEQMRNAVMEGKRKSIPKMKKEREERLSAMEAEYDEADRVLDKLFGKYGVPHKKEDRLFLKFYGEGKYRDPDAADNPWASSSSGGSNPWAEAGGEESNPWSSE